MNKISEHKSIKRTIYSILGALIVLLIVFYSDWNREQKIDKNAVYSIGQVYDFIHVKGRVDIAYQFEYKSRTYKGRIVTTLNKEERELIRNKKFIVEVDSTRPTRNNLLLEYYVKTDTVVPYYGWKSIPVLNKK